MRDSDDRLGDRVRHAWQHGAGDGGPPFDRVWRAAEQTRAATLRQRRWLAAGTAVVAAVAVAVYLQAPQDESRYIEVAELLDSTYWSAPSDVLLPKREFDIYQDMPVLFESTEPAEGALL